MKPGYLEWGVNLEWAVGPNVCASEHTRGLLARRWLNPTPELIVTCHWSNLFIIRFMWKFIPAYKGSTMMQLTYVFVKNFKSPAFFLCWKDVPKKKKKHSIFFSRFLTF